MARQVEYDVVDRCGGNQLVSVRYESTMPIEQRHIQTTLESGAAADL
jgi:hypothetical protein